MTEKPYPKSPSVQESLKDPAGTLYTPLKRQLKNRHVAMISIGGVIGTGLFLGTATGLLLGYLAVGTITYSVMYSFILSLVCSIFNFPRISLGEMVAYLPIPGGHIKLAERFVDPAFSFTMGWNYWYTWVIILPTELSAAAVLIDYWDRSVNNAVVVVMINMCGAGVYGECEFIVGLIILGIVLDLGGGPDHDRLGFRFWKHPGPFNQYNGISGAKGRFLGFWAVLTQAAFSYIGTEIVAIAAGEANNPRRNLPKAIRRVYIRILLFYIGGVIIIGLLVPFDNKGLDLASGTAASSPFVIAIQRSGIKALPSIINACLLTSAWSAASSDLYTSSRALYGLAAAGNAPSIFLKTLSNGLPVVSIVFCSLFSTLAYMGVTAGSGTVFTWFTSMTAIAGLMTWFGICVTYLRFYKGMKVQGYDRKALPYASSLQPFAAWYALSFCLFVSILSGWATFLKGNWSVANFITNYLPLGLFPVLYGCAKFYYSKFKGHSLSWVSAEKMDFVSDIAQIEPTPKNAMEAFWAWLVSTSSSSII
ncbi:amino acid permease [Mycena pura]|uniref:Amino acid permease n=1 Tax=Mycena pura TaxID=153505 RepID=A0AAD6YTI6_9AGAR|nr:amino acid permease [Mycena pura]